MSPIKPPKLALGDLIAITAPSLPLSEGDRPTFELAKKALQQIGFRLTEGESLGRQHYWSAGTAQQQAAEINEMFADPEIKAIIAHTGGFSAFDVARLLDYELIAANPKPFIGLSDITVYHWAMLTKANLVGFHGNDFTYGFGNYFWQESAENQAVLADCYVRQLTEAAPFGALPFSDEWEVWRPGQAEGVLLGGNLKRFMLLAGTDYFPPFEAFDNAILFWEEIGETYYDIAIYLQKLKQMGILARIGGMVVCQPVWVNRYFDHLEHPTLQQLVLQETADYNFPILSNIKLGHHTCSLPIPIGLQARLDTDTPEIVIMEAAVS